MKNNTTHFPMFACLSLIKKQSSSFPNQFAQESSPSSQQKSPQFGRASNAKSPSGFDKIDF